MSEPSTRPVPEPAARRLAVLEQAELVPVARLLPSSNQTYVVQLLHPDADALAGRPDAELGAGAFGVYKPVLGERELHDFEPGLHKRERAAYLLSEALGFGLVPPTVIREDGPFGPGSVQWMVDARREHHFFTIRDRPDALEALMRIAAFDIVANNTDRKSGHVLLDLDDRIWAIDQGLCFHHTPKLRTVIWDYQLEDVPAATLEAIAPLADAIPDGVADLLTPREARAMRVRARRLLDDPVFPYDETGWGVPWPMV